MQHWPQHCLEGVDVLELAIQLITVANERLPQLARQSLIYTLFVRVTCNSSLAIACTLLVELLAIAYLQ